VKSLQLREGKKLIEESQGGDDEGRKKGEESEWKKKWFLNMKSL